MSSPIVSVFPLTLKFPENGGPKSSGWLSSSPTSAYVAPGNANNIAVLISALVRHPYASVMPDPANIEL